VTTRVDLIRRILKALDATEGFPLPEETLIDAVTIRFAPSPPRADVAEAIKRAEAQGYISGTEVELQGVVWGLTAKGQSKVRTL